MTGELASIKVRRASNLLTDSLRAYEVVIDGCVAGRIRLGESQDFEVAAGPHEVFLKISWCRSEKIALRLAAGQEAVIDCSARRLITGFYWVTFGRSRYIKVAHVALAGTSDQSPSAG